MNGHSPREDANGRPRWPLILGAVLLLAAAIGFLVWKGPGDSTVTSSESETGEEAGVEGASAQEDSPGVASRQTPSPLSRASNSRRRPVDTGSTLPPKQLVSTKVQQFIGNRRDVVAALARQFKVQLPPEVGQLFDAIRADDWEKAREIWQVLQATRQSSEQPEGMGMHKVWHALVEAYGAAEAAHTWEPQKLLDYGNAILDSLAPGTVYLGGSDAGRFIPALLNETSGNKHVILTQSALADASYLEYTAFMYGDRVIPPSPDDSAQVFQRYMTDAQKRFQHDQGSPNEPKQVRPGENFQSSEGRFNISGQTAVMAINEGLLNVMLQKNPSVRFAIEESFSFDSVYANAAPLGPLIELRAGKSAEGLTANQVNQALEYWGTRAGDFGFGTDPSDAPEARGAWSRMAAAQGNLFLAHEYTGEAEQTFRLAQQISPGTPQAVLPLVDLLARQNRPAEAIPVLERALEVAPGNADFERLLSEMQSASR